MCRSLICKTQSVYMSRTELIEGVKAKLEEISPFDEPQSFIAAGDAGYDRVKPILLYIDQTLDESAKYCLMNLPLSLLSQDIIHDIMSASIDKKGVGHIGHSEDSRLIRVRAELWQRDCTSFITTSDALYLIQQNRFTRGGVSKPIVVYNPEQSELELFSFPAFANETTQEIELWHIPFYAASDGELRLRSAESISSPIYDYIILVCAAQVLDIMGNKEQAAVLRQEYNTRLESEMQ